MYAINRCGFQMSFINKTVVISFYISLFYRQNQTRFYQFLYGSKCIHKITAILYIGSFFSYFIQYLRKTGSLAFLYAVVTNVGNTWTLGQDDF